MTFTVGIARPEAARMFVRRTFRALTRDEIERFADDQISRPSVELVHVRPPTAPGQPWTADVYSHPDGRSLPTDVAVTHDVMARLLP